MRLQKFFSDCGILSRRAAEAEISNGKVTVNGVVAAVGDNVNPDIDVVEYKGQRIFPPKNANKIYIMLHKPRGYVTTAKDEKGRKTVLDLTRAIGKRIYPVGRLDMDSEGLLLLTDDGEFTNHLTHPRHEIPKIYHVTLSSPPTKEQLERLASPMILDGYALQPVQICKHPDTCTLEMRLYEGRNRQIRKMCEQVGLRVARLRRVAIGNLSLGTLTLGKWRHLTQEEVKYLFPNQKIKGD